MFHNRSLPGRTINYNYLSIFMWNRLRKCWVFPKKWTQSENKGFITKIQLEIQNKARSIIINIKWMKAWLFLHLKKIKASVTSWEFTVCNLIYYIVYSIIQHSMCAIRFSLSVSLSAVNKISPYRKVWWSSGQTPGEVPGPDGKPEGQESRLCLSTSFWGLPAEVTDLLLKWFTALETVHPVYSLSSLPSL